MRGKKHPTRGPARGAVQLALDEFLEAPTHQNKSLLMETADAYRECWIEAHAKTGPRRTAPRLREATVYERVLTVRETVDGIPVDLALQKRNSGTSPSPWWTLSWRTKYQAGGANRRFYVTKDGFWTIPACAALQMLERLEGLGGLSAKYFDHRFSGPVVAQVSCEIPPDQRLRMMSTITAPDEDWGKTPVFVVTSDADFRWKKVMIVHPESGAATFRSITEDPNYMPRKVLREGEGWWLDNSMMDASVQQMIVFYKYLQQLAARGGLFGVGEIDSAGLRAPKSGDSAC